MTRVTLDLPDDQARALAQLAKRFTHDHCKLLASRYDGGEEADAMWQGVLKLQRALAEAGLAPR
jgi:hypothetical protein